MVVCIIALPVLLVLGIFSAYYRSLAKEALKCAFNKLTLRPCDLTLEQKLKKKVFSSLSKKNEKLAFFAFKHFEKLSIIFGTLMVLSIAGTVIGFYNFFAYGNCNGPATNELCVFNPETYSSGIEIFGLRFFETIHSTNEIKTIVLGNAPSTGNQNAPIQIIEVGCFTCPYTKAAEPLVKELLEKYGEKIFFSFKYFPLPNHSYSFEAANSAECAREQNKFWEYKEKLFEHQQSCLQSQNSSELKQKFFQIATDIGLNQPQFQECVETEKYNSTVQEHKQHAINAGIYGTPTFYVNNTVLVAPKTIQEFEEIINKQDK